jgi:AraC-like DNA-binding protein
MRDIGSNNSNLVKKAQEFIEKNIKNSQLSLEYVADELGVNQKNLSRTFRNETGVKFIDYLTNLKLNYCRNLLVNTNLKVEEISNIMGYSTPQYFISRFKIMFGCTPYKYRQKNISKDLISKES